MKSFTCISLLALLIVGVSADYEREHDYHPNSVEYYYNDVINDARGYEDVSVGELAADFVSDVFDINNTSDITTALTQSVTEVAMAPVGWKEALIAKLKAEVAKIAKKKALIKAKLVKTMVILIKKIKAKLAKIAKYISEMPMVGKFTKLYNSVSPENVHSSLVSYLGSSDYVNKDALYNINLWNMTLEDMENLFAVDGLGAGQYEQIEDVFLDTIGSVMDSLVDFDKKFKSYFQWY